jgi:hypothetical protein
MPFMSNTAYNRRASPQQQWFPQIYGDIYKRLGQGQESEWNKLRELMSYSTGQLGKTMTQEMGKMNVPIAGSWDMIARRFMGPMQTQIQNWWKMNQPSEATRMGQSMGLAKQVYPLFNVPLWKDRPANDAVSQLMQMLFGAGGGRR